MIPVLNINPVMLLTAATPQEGISKASMENGHLLTQGKQLEGANPSSYKILASL